MASGGSGPGDVFDVRKVRRLVELMNEHDLAEIDLRQSDQRIRLRRGQDPVMTVPYAPPHTQPPTPTTPPPTPPGEAASAAEEQADTATYVTSPMVGTFYSSANPDASPFVKVGDQVGDETVICVIEAMKVFNEISAECSGKIVATLVENGDAVEFGQKLFKIEPAK